VEIITKRYRQTSRREKCSACVLHHRYRREQIKGTTSIAAGCSFTSTWTKRT
jgi:hypothetical protein